MRPKLVNDFAFKYVFGADTKDSNNALKAILETFLERKIDRLQVKNPELVKNVENMKDSRFDILVRFNDSVQMDIEMQVYVDAEELIERSIYYCTRLHSSQDLKGKLYSKADKSYVLAILKENLFHDELLFHTVGTTVLETNELFSDTIGLYFVELDKLDESKPKEEMSQKELMMYYFLHCQDKGINSKMKEIIEHDEVIQMIDRRVDQIEEDRWRKLDDEFAELHRNEREVRLKRQEEELQKVEEELQKKNDALRKAEEALEEKNESLRNTEKALEKKNESLRNTEEALEKKNESLKNAEEALQMKNDALQKEKEKERAEGKVEGRAEGRAEGIYNVIKALSLTMSEEEIAKALNKTTSEIRQILKG